MATQHSASRKQLDEIQLRLYVDTIERATVSKILAYLMAVGLGAVYKDPADVLQKVVFGRASACLFSFLVFTQNQRN